MEENPYKDPEFKIVLAHKDNFEMMLEAARNGDLALMDCTLKATGEHVAVITAVSVKGKQYLMTPIAMFFNGNPYELLDPPPEAKTELVNL
jgi:hypothetical protein